MADRHVETVQAWLKTHWTEASCPICHSSESKFGVGEVVELPSYTPRQKSGFYTAGREIHPVVPIICENCGYVFLMNAVIMGIV